MHYSIKYLILVCEYTRTNLAAKDYISSQKLNVSCLINA